jgi:lipid-A-disaccharide synthase
MPDALMIITGESSGELYGSLLASQVKKQWPHVRVLGVGGEKMRSAGVEIISGIAHAFGLFEALSSLKKVKETLNRTLVALEEVRPEVVVLIDYPDFNFRVGRRARELGIKVLYYVSPQVWAWRSGRIKTMATFVDRMAVLLPFEEPLYRNSGIPCEFVGHPIMEDMESYPTDKSEAKRILGIDADNPCLAVLPGSRASELSRLLPLMLKVVKEFRKNHPDWGFVLPVAPNVNMEDHRDGFDQLRDEGVVLTSENAVLAFSASDAAVVASGTAAFQAVLRETPLVVVYRVSPLSYVIGRIVIQVPYVNLANIILGREAVPELIQGKANASEVLRNLEELVQDSESRSGMLRDLVKVRAMFEGKKPTQRVADMVGELAGWGGSEAA